MRHLVVGAGPAGVIAAETLRGLDPRAEITLLGDEPGAPYSRMALPYLLREQIDEAGTHLRHGPSHYERLGITVRQGRAAAVACGERTVSLESGETLAWDRLLIATGSRATRPPVEGADLPGVESCWTLADASAIAARARPGSRVVLLGAGFIGCIVLEALAARGVSLTVVEVADRMLARMMDEEGGAMLRRWCESRGVAVLTGARVEAIRAVEPGSGLILEVAGREPLPADLVVCATGVRPNVELLEGTGVAVEDGILVDHRMATSADGIYAAGDVAQGPVFDSEAREVHAIQPTASEHGRIAARAMAGSAGRYQGSLSMNVLSTLGLISSSFGRWAGVEGGARAVASDPDGFRYLRLEFDEDRLVGALALGLTRHVGVLRGLIQTRTPLGPWRDRLLADPHRAMEAYLESTQGQAQIAIASRRPVPA